MYTVGTSTSKAPMRAKRKHANSAALNASTTARNSGGALPARCWGFAGFFHHHVFGNFCFKGGDAAKAPSPLLAHLQPQTRPQIGKRKRQAVAAIAGERQHNFAQFVGLKSTFGLGASVSAKRIRPSSVNIDNRPALRLSVCRSK